MRTNKAKQQAILDIQEDLYKQGKCFFAFVKKLNPVMGTLVRDHINAQNRKTKQTIFKRPKATLTATCLFASSQTDPQLINYPETQSILRHRKNHENTHIQ